MAHVLATLGRAATAAGSTQVAGSGEAAAVLTPRELDVLKLVAQGLSNPDIARRLVLSEHTVHRHLANILRKLNLSSRAAAAAWGVRTGLVCSLARPGQLLPADEAGPYGRSDSTAIPDIPLG